jgi:cyclopropane fatty-acyl-phospholipid synthase-like methyltransferase
MTYRDIVRAGYDEIGARYHDWSHRSATRRKYVGRVLDRLPPGSTVVDLGCGPGDPATRLLSERHHVLGVDLSAAQLRLARRLAPSAALVQADVCAFELARGSVDAVVSFYVLGHLPAGSHAPLVASIARWLRPGGLLLTSAPLSAQEGVEPDWLGVPMFFGGIGRQATEQAVAAAGLDLESVEEVPEDEGNGRVVSFLWVTAARRPY